MPQKKPLPPTYRERLLDQLDAIERDYLAVLEAAEMFARGMRPPQVAERLRISPKSARAWHARWREGGIEALRSRGPSGPSSRFKPQWRPEPAALLEQGPAAHGWVEDQRWTLARVATVIGRRWHISLSVPQTWRLLRQMGFTAQVPVHRAAERDEQAVATWVEEVWPVVERR
ncbi:winged helix-turn-helix domain-containing protein [Streptomyces kebangsaanensis]|uniref:winged helix-turn-helix domain-containing protein n=1 Tax=Streptomyces kebangsaanensis TaxID=864058 RepID=UPI0009A11871|nr:winged helix-turn-helix domain-containing protein [Streptomyces kebangsaanensis]